MHLVVFPQNLNLAAQIVVWTLHQLEFAEFFVLLHLLSLHFLAALVVAI